MGARARWGLTSISSTTSGAPAPAAVSWLITGSLPLLAERLDMSGVVGQSGCSEQPSGGVLVTLGGVVASVAGRRRGVWRSRWAAVGAAVAVTLGGGGMVVVNAASGVPSSVVT
jgi:hypothetical protein